jgi:two-component system response regulator YesN
MDQMVKVLIVDDEINIRSGIKKSIPWDEFGMEVIGEAENGESAIAIYNKYSPDIIVLDINMSGMNGMEVARYIRVRSQETQIIFLTGYDDFHKVKEAVTLQASDYLLKPVAFSELVQALQKAAIQVKMTQRQIGLVDDLKLKVSLYKQVATDQILLDVLQQRRSFADAAESLAEIGLTDGQSQSIGFLCTDIDYYEVSFGQLSEHDRQLYMYAYRKLAQEVLEEQQQSSDEGSFIRGYVLNLTVSRLLIMIQLRAPTEKLQYHIEEQLLVRIAKKLQEAYRTYLKMSISIGVSQTEQGVDKLYNIYKEAVQAVDYRAMIGQGNIIPSRLVDPLVFRSQKLLSKELFILGELKAGTEIRNTDLLEEWFEEIGAMPFTDAKIIASQLVVYTLRMYDESKHERPMTTKVPLAHIVACETIQCLTEYLKEFLINIGDRIRGSQTQPAMRIIEMAKQWIRQHLNSEISLNALAAALHINPFYLSRLFKQTTDETYLEFTTRIRFDRARELLVNSTLKMHEIAEQIGFKDANYFSIAFKKHQGVSPTDYRKRFS